MAHAIDPSVTLLICSSFLIIQHEIPLPPPSWAHATGPSPNILRVQSFVLPDGCYYHTSSIHHAIIERVSIYTISSRSACASSSPNIFANEPMSVPISDVNELTKGGRLFWGEKTKIGQHVLLTGRLFSHCGEGEKPVGPVLIRRGGGGGEFKGCGGYFQPKNSFFLFHRLPKQKTVKVAHMCCPPLSRVCQQGPFWARPPVISIFEYHCYSESQLDQFEHLSLDQTQGAFPTFKREKLYGGFCWNKFFFSLLQKRKIYRPELVSSPSSASVLCW